MKIQQDAFEAINSMITKGFVKKNEPLSSYTFTKTGGICDVFVAPGTYEEVQNVIRFAKEEEIPLTILGNGSNVIIKDGGIRGIVLNLLQLSEIRLENNQIIAQSGAKIIDTSRFARDDSFTGLEFACGIPGSVGGAVYMNAGAYGGEIKDCLLSALVCTKDGELKTLSNEELAFSYRHSVLTETGDLVLEARFALEKGEKEAIEAKMNELTFLRESKQPLEYPSCGSVFKRPEGYFAGKLIQDCHLQGCRIGGVEVSKKHAGFMVNVNNGSATDYIQLIKHVQKTVKDNFHVTLEPEVKIIGEEN